jgi:hypothetical protein
MASERDLELLDDYISNRLPSAEKATFEQRLQSDPSLLQELKLQQDLAHALRAARKAQLKQTLNRIPASELTGDNSSYAKWFLAAAGALIIAAGSFYFLNDTDNSTIQPSAPVVEREADNTGSAVTDNAQPSSPEAETKAEPEQTKPAQAAETPKEDSKGTQAVATKPSVDVYVPADEEQREPTKIEAAETKEPVTKSTSIQSQVVTGDKKYEFHYQLNGDNLILYGPFDNNLYTILEFLKEKRVVFLHYKDKYYLLSEDPEKVSRLIPVTDAALLAKLKEYRGN